MQSNGFLSKEFTFNFIFFYFSVLYNFITFVVMKNIVVFLSCCILLLSACQNKEVESSIEVDSSEELWVKMLVEIPAGTVEKYELNKVSGALQIDSVNGQPRLIEYLGYPANYGMIPQTLLPKSKGGDGDPLDILAIGPPAERGAIINCKVIGVLKLLDKGEQDDKLIAITKNATLQEVNSIQDLQKKYPGITEIIETWFTNYKGPSKMISKGYGSSASALSIYQEAQLPNR